MAMALLVDALNKGLQLVKHGDDDFYDRLSSRYSVGICLVLAVIVTTVHFASDPINCFTPNEFNSQWTKYADRYCWVSKTHYVPWNERLPGPTDVPIHREISYYQWTPFVLMLQACMFTLPRIVWSFSTHYVGYNVNRIVSMCNSPENINPESRDKMVKFLTNQIDRLLGYRREFRQEGWLANAKHREQRAGIFLFGKRFGSHLVWIYLLVKILFIGNALGQLFLMNSIIGKGFAYYGWDVLMAVVKGVEWEESPIFPRVTICNFKIRRLGDNTHRYTVQCILPINLYNEKIYLFLWWWMTVLLVASSIGFLAWLPTLFPAANKRYISKYLKIMGRSNPKEKEARTDFVVRYLRLDGVFVMRLIANNVTDLTAGEIITSLYDNFVAFRAKEYRPSSPVSKPKLRQFVEHNRSFFFPNVKPSHTDMV